MKQPEALRLAEILEDLANHGSDSGKQNAAAELRRLHEVNQELLESLKSLEQTAGLALLHNDPVRFRARAAIVKGEQQ